MSSSPLVVFMALSSFLIIPGGPIQEAGTESVSDLLLRDDVAQAELLLDRQPITPETTALRGEVAYRKGDFARAEALYHEALARDQKTARAHFGLGKLAITKLRGDDAIQALNRAIELAPDFPLYRLYASEAYAILKNYSEQRRQLEEYVRLNPTYDSDRIAEAKAGIVMLEKLGTSELIRVEAPEDPGPIPLRKALNLIFTNVMVNGQGPYDFAVDTGATQTVLSEKVAMDLGLQPVTTTIMHGVGGAGKIDSKIYSVAEISLGDLKIANVPAGTFADPLLTQLADGILSTAVLSDFAININYPQSQMELTRSKSTAASDEILPARYFSNLLLVPLEVNGRRGNFIVDTGAVATVLSHSMAAELGVTEQSPGARVDIGIVGVGGFEGVVLRVPDVTFKTPNRSEVFPQVVSIDLRQISRMIGTEIAGVIGYDFLQEYQVILDYYGAEVRLRPLEN
jgi:tetratricopeptide (TPR) repeat protein